MFSSSEERRIKRCPTCGIEKSLDGFHRDKNRLSGRMPVCKECRSLTSKVRYARDLPKSREKGKQNRLRNKTKNYAASEDWRKRNPGKQTEYRLKRYGLTMESFLALLESQSHACMVCLKRFENRKDTHIDHDHVTGKVRGLLCLACNTMLGYSKDSPATLRRAADYLEKTSCVADEILTQ